MYLNRLQKSSLLILHQVGRQARQEYVLQTSDRSTFADSSSEKHYAAVLTAAAYVESKPTSSRARLFNCVELFLRCQESWYLSRLHSALTLQLYFDNKLTKHKLNEVIMEIKSTTDFAVSLYHCLYHYLYHRSKPNVYQDGFRAREQNQNVTMWNLMGQKNHLFNGQISETNKTLCVPVY